MNILYDNLNDEHVFPKTKAFFRKYRDVKDNICIAIFLGLLIAIVVDCLL